MTTSAEVLLDADELDAIVVRLAAELSAAHPQGCLLVGLLKSSVVPLADVCRKMTVPVQIDFLALSAYAPDSGRVQLMKDLDDDIAGRHVVLFVNLVDTGMRVGFLRGELERRRPASLSVATMFDKAERRILPVPIDFVGAEVPNEFLLGYGLDYEGYYRNVEYLFVGDLDELEEDPGRYTAQVYGRE